jgi:hypothetical protein
MCRGIYIGLSGRRHIVRRRRFLLSHGLRLGLGYLELLGLKGDRRGFGGR